MRHGNDQLCRSGRPSPAAHPPRPADSVAVVDAHLELELRKMLAEREIRRQLFAYHEAMNRADYEALFEAAPAGQLRGVADRHDLAGEVGDARDVR